MTMSLFRHVHHIGLVFWELYSALFLLALH